MRPFRPVQLGIKAASPWDSGLRPLGPQVLAAFALSPHCSQMSGSRAGERWEVYELGVPCHPLDSFLHKVSLGLIWEDLCFVAALTRFAVNLVPSVFPYSSCQLIPSAPITDKYS